MQSLKRGMIILILLTGVALGGCIADTNEKIYLLQHKLDQIQYEATDLVDSKIEQFQAITEFKELESLMTDFLENPYQLGEQLATEKCSSCHDLQLINDHERASTFDWGVEIDNMSEFGADINEEQRDFLVHYYERKYSNQ